MRDEVIIATWPQTGHRLVRAMNLPALLNLELIPKKARIQDIMRMREGEFTGKYVTLFVVNDNNETVLQHSTKTGSKLTVNTTQEGTGPEAREARDRAYGYLVSLWPLTNNGPVDLGSMSARDIRPIDPGPMEVIIDAIMYSMLGVDPPWLWHINEFQAWVDENLEAPPERGITLAMTPMRRAEIVRLSAMTIEQLFAEPTHRLDRAAWGTDGTTPIEVPLSRLLTRKGDMVQAEFAVRLNPTGWVEYLDEPIEVKLDKHGRMHLEDGHHRYVTALQRGHKTLPALIEPQGNPVSEIVRIAKLLRDQ